MSERKKRLDELAKEEELRLALKEINRGKKKEKMKKLLSLLKTCFEGTKVVVLFVGGKLLFVFKKLGEFSKAVFVYISLNLFKIGRDNPKKLGGLFVTQSAIIAVLMGLLFNSNVGDFNLINKISDKDVKGEGENVVMAGEIGTEEAKKVDEALKKAEKVASNEEVDVYVIGEVSTKHELGSENMSAIVENSSITKYGQFSLDKNRDDYIIGFFKYMNEKYPNMYKENFSSVGKPGSSSFKEAWEKTSEKEGKNFNNMQVRYMWETLVQPIVNEANKTYKVDFSKTLLLQELIYSTVSQYGAEKTTELIKNAKLNEKMSDIEILNALQDEKINSLGNYTYTSDSEKEENVQNAIKNRINEERIDLSRLSGKKAISI